MTTYRQGDVLLESIEDIPESAAAMAVKVQRVILAEGEATGHHHSVPASSATLLERGAERFLRVRRQCALVHQEHAPIDLPIGSYHVVRQREYHPEAIRNVAD